MRRPRDMSEELHHLTIARGSSLIRAGALSPVAWTEHLLARIAALDPVLDSFVRVIGERALAQARAAEDEIARGQYRGPLHGVPYAAKDIYDTGGIATTGGSRLGQFRVPERDASAVSRLGKAGAVLLGKLTTHEFAYGGPSFDLPWPPARNPWDARRFSGGSSSGSGAAVAAGLVPAALGSDTAGSIRQPAAFCGVAGMKPTPGLVSRAGVLPFSQSTDTCGPLAWTVEDCAIVLGALAGFDPDDPQSADAAVPDFRRATVLAIADRSPGRPRARRARRLRSGRSPVGGRGISAPPSTATSGHADRRRPPLPSTRPQGRSGDRAGARRRARGARGARRRDRGRDVVRARRLCRLPVGHHLRRDGRRARRRIARR